MILAVLCVCASVQASATRTARSTPSTPATPAVFQCPDGSPPPCRGAAPATPRLRPAPPLDARTWIVLPFENVARATDIDWLRDASVNLLYLDLSRWRDIRVVDDERVADLMREVPEIRPGAQLSLQNGMAVARRAGAGKLVMGDLLKVGNRTQVVAKVYDVRSGNRLRTVRQETQFADSIMPVFGRLARGILDVAPPEGASVGVIGTTSVDAYRAYSAGVSALNRVDLATAHAMLDTAISLDSSFALAHYKMSVVLGWENPNDRRRPLHAEAANRNARSLPPRERALITGLVQSTSNRWGEACETYAQLLRADSNDVEAWYNLGECNYHDQRALADSGAPQATFRANWNLALRAFARAMELDPTYHLAFAHVPDILQVDQRAGCRTSDVMANCPNHDVYLGYVLRSGDSLVLTPHKVQGPQAPFEAQRLQQARTGVWRTNLEQSMRVAEAWVAAAGPNEPRAHQALARTLLRMGRPQEAARAFARATTPPRTALELQRFVVDRLELLIKLDSGEAAGRFADSLIRAGTIIPGATTLPAFAAVIAGRLSRVPEIFSGNQQPNLLNFIQAWPAAYAGVPPADFLERERRLESFITAQAGSPANQRVARSVWLSTMIPWTLELRRDPVPDLDTASGDVRIAFSAIAVTGDTARIRRALLRLDSAAMSLPLETPEASLLLIAAEGWLHLGDSAQALSRLTEWGNRFPYLNLGQPMHGNFGNLSVNSFTWGRGWLRLADLAAARGRRNLAANAYRKVLLWTGGDTTLQPAVERARAYLGQGN